MFTRCQNTLTQFSRLSILTVGPCGRSNVYFSQNDVYAMLMMQYNILIFLYLNEDQHQALFYTCYPCNIIFHFHKKNPLLCKKMFQGGIDLTLVGPTDIGISEKGSKTITEPATKESGVQGGATSPPQTQEGSEWPASVHWPRSESTKARSIPT